MLIPVTTVQQGQADTELDYAEITADVTVASTNSASPTTTIITGAAVAYDGATRVKLEVFSPFVFSANAGTEIFVSVWDGSTDVGRICDLYVASSVSGVTLYGARFFTPSNASHTYSIRAYKSAGAGTSTFGANTGGVNTPLPAFMRITRA